ncbi:hypothetical protein [Variovorax boronicumulans]|uniref:hypothetical protein n=1 Tax=Variovorax boronicumulans TaxID=436515 RepID=UPI001C55A585
MNDSAKRFLTVSFLACSVLALAACGGGGSDDSDSSTPSGGSSSSGSGSGAGTDALGYSKVSYQYSCQGVPGTKTIEVSNGPCITQQKAYMKATTCNEPDANYSFNTVGKPFYQCAVNNTTDAKLKTYYQQYLTFYSK